MYIYNNTIIDNKIDKILEKNNLDKIYKSDLLYIIFHVRTYPFKDRRYMNDDMEYVPIKLEYLRNLITYNKTNYFLDLLVNNGILETDNRFIVGSKSKGYRLAEKYKKGKFYLEELENKRLAEKIKRVLDGLKNKILERNDAYAYVTRCMENLIIDADKARKTINKLDITKNNKAKISTMVDIFDTKFAKIDKTANRLHNNLTNIATVLRKHITYKGLEIVQCDLKNSQPLLLKPFIMREYPYLPKEELDKYEDVVCNIGFYEFFAEKLKIELTDENRQSFKKKIFSGVLFDVNRRGLSKYEKVFKEEFPIIFRCLRDSKKDCHKIIPINLQKLESDYIFKCVDILRERYKDIELLTIHDSIACVQGNEDKVYEVMMNQFIEMFNIKPKIKTEKFAY